jgi:hypothetical protein
VFGQKSFSTSERKTHDEKTLLARVQAQVSTWKQSINRLKSPMEYYTLPDPLQYLIHDYALIAVPILYLVWVIASRSSQMAAEKKGVPATQYPKIVSIVYNAIQVALSCYMAYGIFGPGGFNFRYHRKMS